VRRLNGKVARFALTGESQNELPCTCPLGSFGDWLTIRQQFAFRTTNRSREPFAIINFSRVPAEIKLCNVLICEALTPLF
jgi:hypothetical protein